MISTPMRGNMKVRYLVRSGMNGRPETVLQFSYGWTGSDEVWTDVPICYTEEVMNDHHDKWPDDYKITEN